MDLNGDYSVVELGNKQTLGSVIHYHHKTTGQGILDLQSGFFHPAVSVCCSLFFDAKDYFNLDSNDLVNLCTYDLSRQMILFNSKEKIVLMNPQSASSFHGDIPLVTVNARSDDYAELILVFNKLLTLDVNSRKFSDCAKLISTKLLPQNVRHFSAMQKTKTSNACVRRSSSRFNYTVKLLRQHYSSLVLA